MDFFHGVARLKEDLEGTDLKAEDTGLVTAYLPEMQKFAVRFVNVWMTFNCTEERFLELFEFHKYEASEEDDLPMCFTTYGIPF